ncbi:MAG TPA: hypothetical protein PKN80_04525 [bacterium]|nr:hypothetical protein [bacterium]HNS48821.1 hypothetical protein [bacterium]
MKYGMLVLSWLTLAVLTTSFSSAEAADEGTIGPWRVGDMAYSKTPANDRPNAESQRIVERNYTALVSEKLLTGEKGKLTFRVAPRNERWAGILVMDNDGKPLPYNLKRGAKVSFAEAGTGKTDPAVRWYQYDTKVLYSDASKVFPKTRMTVTQGNEVLDEVTVDFSQWQLPDSRVNMAEMLDGPTSRHGFVTARDGKFWRDGQEIYFFGGHENHVPGKELSDLYAETYADAGINVQRSIAFGEIVKNFETGEVDPVQLDKYLYLIAKLGERGIYFFLTNAGHNGYGYPRGKTPEPGQAEAGDTYFWINPRYREVWQQAWKTILTTTNPYTGKALKDDPTLIGLELCNETGLNPRRFDYNRLDNPDQTAEWRRQFNKYLLNKYGSRAALAEAWKTNPLFPHEDPAKGNILIPTNFRGSRSPYGGSGQHNQYTTGRWYRGGLPADKNPRILDAIEFNNTVARKPYPFDFNNLSTPEESEKLRLAFNEFLLKKYGSREALAKAWEEDQLFPWESPDVIMVKTSSARTAGYVPDPSGLARTIVIPSNYRGETEYRYEPDRRQADPRVSDAIEFTYQVQKVWATDMAKFLKEEVGVKCGVGWNGDTFHMVQGPTHKANMDSPLDIAIAAAYLDTDNGDQVTSRIKNLKRFNTYGRIYGRPMFSYEWSMWSNQGPFVYEYGLMAALMGRTYGFDGYAHHKMSAQPYPVSDPGYSLRVHYITPLTDRPRRGSFYVSQWILQRSKIEENDQRILIGMPDDDMFIGGPERKMSNWAFENWIMYQLGIEDYSFKSVYDGPEDRIVIHDGRGPYGDYRKAKHAILWCHSNSDREGKDPKAKEKWFALHGITFKPGQKYFLNDQFFATTEDMTDWNVVHRIAEKARQDEIDRNAKDDATKLSDSLRLTTSASNYWAAEPKAQPTELDRQVYRALKKWGYPLPFSEDELDKVWRSRDRSMVMDTPKQRFTADRGDMQLWFGKAGRNTRISLSRLSAVTSEPQYAAALLPWDTADFATAKTLALWTLWNSEVTVKLAQANQAKVYAVNWLGKRIFEVKPTQVSSNSLSFQTARHDDIFCYEIIR